MPAAAPSRWCLAVVLALLVVTGKGAEGEAAAGRGVQGVHAMAAAPGLSQECKADSEKLRTNSAFTASYDALVHDAKAVDGEATQTCLKSGGSCETKWGTASPCCSASGEDEWNAKYKSAIADNLNAGNAALGGAGGTMMWVRERLVINGPTLISLDIDGAFPAFVPQSCNNPSDLSALASAETRQCLAGSPSLLQCDFVLHA